ncbi:MAG: DUF4256 domain-containing protein [Anaerolineae bacterium]
MVTLSASQQADLLETLQARFEANPQRHPNVPWAEVRAKLEGAPRALWSLSEMERTGGEPDVVVYDAATGAYVFMDCAAQSPEGRRSLCYDGAARAGRKTAAPSSSAQEMAAAMGVQLLTEALYRALQAVGEFDTKTSSWIDTPADIRAKGGALFMDRRYGHVFVYHNGADSYYAARGFRACVWPPADKAMRMRLV